MRKLSDAEVTRLRELAGEGRSARDLADLFGVSRQHVGRLLRGESRRQVAGLDAETASGSLVAAVERFLDGLTEFDASHPVLAETALVLAAKLDQARVSSAAASATSVPALAKQLVDTIATLRGEFVVPDALDDLRRRRDARRLALLRGGARGKRKAAAR